MDKYIEISINKDDQNYNCLKSYFNNEDLLLDSVYQFNVKELYQESYDKGKYIGEIIEDYSYNILKKFKFNIQLRNFIAYIMRELIRNIPEHSNAETGLIYIYINKDKEIGFKVIDNGIGIKKSLNSNPRYSIIKDDLTAITLAVKPGVSKAYKYDYSRDDTWQNSGFGLYMVSSICKRFGYFKLKSGTSSITVDKNFIDYKSKRKRLKGTCVTAMLKYDLINNIPKLLKEISVEGTKKANSYDLSKIKTASKASTLISD